MPACPRCDRPLKETTCGDLTLDACEGGCGGVWFDRYELQKLDEPGEDAHAILDVRRDPSVVVDLDERISCPTCKDVVMMRHYFTTRHEVEVDECPACAGFWLDQRELAKIRSLFGSEDDANEAARAQFRSEFGAQLDAMALESEQNLHRAQRFAKFFRFLCPSYYMAGRQEWGAF